jgi:hypothetical protein
MRVSSDITKLARIIFKEIVESDKDNIDLDKYCAEKLKSVYRNISDLEIADELEEVVEKVKFYINKRKEYCDSQGITPEYEFNDYPSNTLFRYSIKHKEDVWLSFLRRHKKNLQKAINKMSWKDFEKLCEHLLEINGVEPVILTRVNQEGIDFCGLYNIGSYISSMIIPQFFQIKIVGQIKHYSDKIQPKLLRSFYTYCESIKNREDNIIRKLPNWFNEAKTPVLGIFITTSDFTKGAIKFAKKEWIITKNGEQFVEDLIKSPKRQMWISQNRNSRLTFDKNAFLQFFTKG